MWRAWLVRSMVKEITRGSQAWDPQAASVWWNNWNCYVILGKVFAVHTLPIPCLNQNMAIFMIILTIFILIKGLTMRWVRGCITWSPSASCWLLFKGVGEPVGRLWTREKYKTWRLLELCTVCLCTNSVLRDLEILCGCIRGFEKETGSAWLTTKWPQSKTL